MKLLDRLKSIPEMLLDDRNRFWSFVTFKGPDDCWVFSKTAKSGYGTFSLKGENFIASRISWYLSYGEPGRLFVLHECNNPSCCNPKHLYRGTQAENVKQIVLDGRRSYQDDLCPAAKFYNEEIIKIRQRYADGESTVSIGKSLGVTRETIRKIVRYQSYSGVS